MSSAEYQSAEKLVKDLVGAGIVVIFSKSYCPYSRLAKDVFNKMNQAYTVIEVDGRKDGSEIQDVLSDMTGARTVPRVFVKGKFVGGGSDVKELYESGKLAKLLK